MKKIYLTDKQALAFYHEKASPEFWDRHWQIADLRRYLESSTNDGLFIPAVRRNLPSGSLVLEGGCGRGQIVHALQYNGYRVIGIDFASETITRIRQAMPELDVRLGDVRSLEFPDGSLDGYISVGVIEHFWEGHEAIIKEMHRTLRVGGFLFISFPHLSLLRRWKITLGMYSSMRKDELDSRVETFYQFALSARRLQTDLEALGFQFRESIADDGIKGFKDEVAAFRPFLQEIYDGKRAQRLRPYLDKLFKPFASHCALLVLQKRK